MTETRRDSFAGAMREAQRPTGPLVGSIVAVVLFASVMATSILLAIVADNGSRGSIVDQVNQPAVPAPAPSGPQAPVGN